MDKQEIEQRFGISEKDAELIFEQMIWQYDRESFKAIKDLQLILPFSIKPTFVNAAMMLLKVGIAHHDDLHVIEDSYELLTQADVMTPEQYQECEAYWATLETIELLPPETIAKLKPWDATDDPGYDDSPDGQRW